MEIISIKAGGIMSRIKNIFTIALFILLINTALADNIILYPVEDTYIDSINMNSNFASSTSLCSHSSTSTTQYIYLKFYVPEYAVSSSLNMFVTGGFGADNIVLSRVSPDWNAEELTWNHGRPIMDNWMNAVVATSPYSKFNWTTWNTSSVINEPGYYAFLVRSQHGQQHRFNSSESGVNIPYITMLTKESPMDIAHNTKTNNDSYSFIVEENEVITFSLLDKNISSIQWFVNKINQGVAAESFRFTVPRGVEGQPSSQIWEVRVEGTFNNNTTLCREWLISSLTKDEAPDFIEYFIDRNNVWRTGYITDPWGRELPYFDKTNNLVSRGFLSRTDTSTGNVLSAKFNITNGTFRYKIRNPGVQNIYYFKVTDTQGSSWRTEWQSNEFHDYFAINNKYGYIPISKRWLGQAPGVHYWNTNDWITISIIKTSDGWWTSYVNDVMMPHAHSNFENALSNATKLSLASNNMLELDCIEVYRDKYIYPSTTVSYGTYPKWWKTGDVTNGRLDPIDEEGIKVSGKNVTLKQISDMINNPDYITYDTKTRTANLKTNIALYDGSELLIDNERLIVDTSKKSLSISPKVGVKLSIINSTISATDKPLVWNFASSVSENVFDPDESRNNNAATSQPRTNHIWDFRGQLVIENSIIDNTANLFLDAPYEVTVRNVIFSNHSSIDYGDYSLRGSYENHNQKKRQSYGEKGFWIVPRMDLVSFVVENITFVQPKTDVSLKVIGGEWIQNATTVQNSDLRGVSISAMKALKYEYYQNYWNKNEKSTLALLNTLYDENKLSIAGHARVNGRYDYDEAEIVIKYYLDTNVEHAFGNPTEGAEITLVSSNSKYPAESLYQHREYIADKYGPGEGGVSGYGPGYFDADGKLIGNMHNITYSGGTYTRWYNALPLGKAVTNIDGRTSLPMSDDSKNSIILIESVLTSDNGTPKKDFMSYTLNAKALNGQSVSLSNLSPDSSWYREDPDIPTYTITAVIPYSYAIGPNLIGFAPSQNNPFAVGQTKKFRVWADEDMSIMQWYVDGISVSSGNMEYEWKVLDGEHTIHFEGTNKNGTILKTWSVSNKIKDHGSQEPPKDPISSGTGISFTPAARSLTANVGGSTVFSVDNEEFSMSKWYFNGTPVASGTTSYTQNWNSSGSFTIRFEGKTESGTLNRNWDVVVSGSEHSVISIVPSATVVAPGEPFSINVNIDPKQAVTGYQFNVHHNDLASLVSIKDAGLFSATGDLEHIFFSGINDVSMGLIQNIYAARLGSGGVSSPGGMITMNMLAGTSSGMLEMNISELIVSDMSSDPVPCDIISTSVLVDTAPVFNIIPSISVEEGNTLTFTVSASDADGDMLSYAAESLPWEAVFDTSSGVFSWTPAIGQTGTYSSKFLVSDGYLNDTTSVNITVFPQDLAPVISLFEPAMGLVFEEGQIIGIRVLADDPEGKPLTYSLEINGEHVSNSSGYMWTTDYSSAGTHSIKVTVCDGVKQVTQTHTISITDVHPRWDVNEDGKVNILDISLIGRNYGKTYDGKSPRWDVNQDGVVNIQDMSIVAARFGEIVV